MEVLTLPNEKLRLKSRAVLPAEIKETTMQAFIDQLAKTMKLKDGVGLAAPQVGKNLRIIVVDTESGPTVFINPLILWRSIKRELAEEGCLSIPGTWGLVKRSKKIVLTCLDKNGQRKNFPAVGLFARVLQHEIDHLNGILFIDKAIKITKKPDDEK